MKFKPHPYRIATPITKKKVQVIDRYDADRLILLNNKTQKLKDTNLINNKE